MKLPRLLLILTLMTSTLLAKAGPLGFESLMDRYPTVQQHYGWHSYQRGVFLIIAHDDLIANPILSSFITFKERQGFRVELAGLNTTGSTSGEIRSFIADYYAVNDLEYVLLVGDVDDAYALPSFSFGPENDVTDLPYGLITGNDYFPEVFVGRWPVDTQAELAIIINKTIQYASNPYLGSDWLDRALVVAGNFADSGTILTPVWTSIWLRDELIDHGYTQVDTIFFPPVTQPDQILSAWNEGVGIVNYRGWGDAHGWHYPHFHVSDFDEGSLSNGFQLPVVFSFVCGTGKFDSSIDPSFCEAMLTLGTYTVPSGAVAVVAPSDLHTRTKFNNALNTTLWDALMEGHVNELGPALLAAKFGFLDQFTDQLDPGEMAEFYFHTYNVLGDPSLPMWLLTPSTMDVEVADFGTVSWNDGLITLECPDMPEGVFALRQGDELVGAGRWRDGNILIHRFDGAAFRGEGNATDPLEITLNAAGFIPQTIEITPDAGSDVTFDGFTETLYPGLTSCNPVLRNHGTSPAVVSVTLTDAAGSWEFSATDQIVPAGGTLVLSADDAPHLEIGMLESIFDVAINSVSITTAVPVSVIVPDIDFSFGEEIRPHPGSTFEMTLSGSFTGLPNTDASLEMTLSSPSEHVTITADNAAATLETDGTLEFVTPPFTGSVDDIAPGSRIPLVIDFTLDPGGHFYTLSSSILVGSVETTDPTPPCAGGYWAYDNTDTAFPQAPVFDWVELANESGATHYSVGDDDHVLVDIPIAMRYFGEEYTQMTINSNGWAAFGASTINFFRNWSIPMPLGPDAMLAPFWDDLDNDSLVAGQEVPVPIDLYTLHDEVEERFIIEWHEVWNGFGDRSHLETFQIQLWNAAVHGPGDGSGYIDFLYLQVEDVDQNNNYATVGIESPDQNDGIQYVYNQVYAPGAAPLVPGRVIRFTTEAPDNYVATREEASALPVRFALGQAFPNPFNGAFSLSLELPTAAPVTMTLYNLKGQVVLSRDLGELEQGRHTLRQSMVDLPSGIYLTQFRIGSEMAVRKVTLVR